MATLTTNLGLTKPATTDFYDIGTQNDNLDLLDTAIAGKVDTVHVHSIFATCATAAATKAKTITLTDFLLTAGAMAVVTFTNGNTNAAMTLNVSGTGAKSVVWQGATALGFHIRAGKTATFVYNGTNWVLLSADDFMNPTMKMETQTYTGTGTNGSSYANSLTFSITPVVIMVGSGSCGTVYPVPLTNGESKTAYTYMSNDLVLTTLMTLSSKTVSWYSSSSYYSSSQPYAQLNASGVSYTAIAWGY